MTLAFIIVAVLAIIFFFLWERDFDKLIEADGMITRLRNRIDERKSCYRGAWSRVQSFQHINKELWRSY